jgi:hypothetical protein
MESIALPTPDHDFDRAIGIAVLNLMTFDVRACHE